MGMKEVLAEVARERLRQDEKWGQQEHPPELWLAILTEEVGEVATEVLPASAGGTELANYRTELVQVAAVAVAAIEDLDRRS